MSKENISIPTPDCTQLHIYLEKWNTLESYKLQENALDKLFFETYPRNNDINDILIKASSLNDFYSTNILSIFSIAKHILKLNVDDRLKNGDLTLVNDIAKGHGVISSKNKKEIEFYSFASKYCSHHQPLKFAIYDSFVDDILRYFRNKGELYNFKNEDLKDYKTFTEILNAFNNYYSLNTNLKSLDKYLWQLGREYFPKKYKNVRY